MNAQVTILCVQSPIGKIHISKSFVGEKKNTPKISVTMLVKGKDKCAES